MESKAEVSSECGHIFDVDERCPRILEEPTKITNGTVRHVSRMVCFLVKGHDGPCYVPIRPYQSCHRIHPSGARCNLTTGHSGACKQLYASRVVTFTPIEVITEEERELWRAKGRLLGLMQYFS